jgi:hypothetical protein
MFAWESLSAGTVSGASVSGTSLFASERLQLKPTLLPPPFASAYTSADEGSVVAVSSIHGGGLAEFNGQSWDQGLGLVNVVTATQASPAFVINTDNWTSFRTANNQNLVVRGDNPFLVQSGALAGAFTEEYSLYLQDKANGGAPVKVSMKGVLDVVNGGVGSADTVFQFGISTLRSAGEISPPVSFTPMFNANDQFIASAAVGRRAQVIFDTVVEIDEIIADTNAANYGFIWRRESGSTTFSLSVSPIVSVSHFRIEVLG